MNKSNAVKEINLLDLAKTALRFWWMIVIFFIVGLAGGYSFTAVSTKQQYKADTLMYVNNSSSISSTIDQIKSSLSISDISASKSAVDLYCIIIETRTSLDEVSNRLNNIAKYYPEMNTSQCNVVNFGHESSYKYSYENLIDLISVSSVDDTEIFKISVTSTNSMEAVFITNVIADVAQDKIVNIIHGTSVEIVDKAQVTTALSRSFGKNTALGGIVGVVIACLIIFVIYYVDDVIDDPAWTSETYKELPLLSTIPNSSNQHGSRYGSRYGYGYGYGYGYYGYYGKSSNKESKGK